jgi:hypothetical protein
MGDIALSVTMTGGERFCAADAPTLVRQIGQRLALQMAQATLDASQPHVPEDTGDLKGSGAVEPTNDGALVRYSAGYAGEVHGPIDGSGAGERTPPRLVPIDQLRGWAERHSIPVHLVQHAIAQNGTPYVPFLAEGWNEVQGQRAELIQAAATELRAALTGGN